MNRFYTLRTPFFSPDDLGGGAPAAGGDTSAPAPQPATTTAAPDTTGQTNVNTPSPVNQGNQPEPSWLRGRLEETRAAARREAEAAYNQRYAQQQAQFEAVQRQLHALVGVTPQEDPEIATVRAQFSKLYPGLAALEQRAQDLTGLLEQSQDVNAVTQHHWANYGRQTMDRLYDAAAKSMGGPLNDEAKRALHTAFTGYVSSSPEAGARYAQDPTIVDDFWQMFSGSFIEPVRRSAQAGVQSQTAPRAIPQDTPAGVPGTQQAPKPGSLDERVAGAWASFNAFRNNK
jgi:hypothetical protein